MDDLHKKFISSSIVLIECTLSYKHWRLFCTMKKGKGIGIAVAVIALAIVFGIASIPDEVLLESPSVDTSETEEMNIPEPIMEKPQESAPEETPVEVVEEPEEPAPEETPVEVVEEPEEPAPEETAPEESEDGNVIRVGIKDGIGSGDR